MREIKLRYRFHNRKTKETIMTCLTIDQVEIQGLSPNPFEGLDWQTLSRDQFTGILDSKGVPIYEGDVVENERGEKGKIVFWEGAFISAYLPPYNWDAMEPYDGLLSKQTVIGNIYENPELLEAT
uniref:Putative YopX protein n=1 Tax=viral metagenome TaxID=1070528 RepID=A0A6M3JWZ1_9ZZZZ